MGKSIDRWHSYGSSLAEREVDKVVSLLRRVVVSIQSFSIEALMRRLGPKVVVGVLVSVLAHAEGPSGAVLVNTCFSCHGSEGHSVGAMPSIAGKDADYIERRLRDYRDGRLEGTVMNRIARGFSDAEIERLARYFADGQ